MSLIALSAGFLPLLDSVLLVLAREKGFAAAEGLLAAPTEVPSTAGTLVIGPDGFFDGVQFDPDQVEGYIEGQRAL